ncbi:RNA-directed DNA polymerase [Duganella sp. FT92W]|uniref:RNA-directed DNA polymerase n=1 Tax=Pseudoduganella rivuli TaxID=2666085 RepID=A0A7X2LX54_9BURK|nr:reverse transcriptase family protein [Pseudoduganella rivuli]MRV75842.1 RNA-directed DNA polymerase [Pseudoduganella rivuli]
MSNWQSQLFKQDAPPGAPVSAAIAIASEIRSTNPFLPPLFTLAHLAHETGVPYKFLRSVVARTGATEHYTVFKIKKRSQNAIKQYRWIAAPHPFLLRVQRWINDNILKKLPVNEAAFAYLEDRSAYKAAIVHKNAKWLMKVDIENFFETVLETRIYKIFLDAGYQPLLSFELSRICTRIANPELERAYSINGFAKVKTKGTKYVIEAYASSALGHLPQGAPTSPMLANLIAKDIDEKIAELADRFDLRYTRYSDDIVLSSKSNDFGKANAAKAIGQLYAILRRAGFQPNMEKTKVSGPGSKMIALGLLVDGNKPRLTSEFKDKLKMHLYFCRTRSPQAHAVARKFDSVIGLKNHLLGLISYARMVDSSFADECLAQMNSCHWPITGPIDLSLILESLKA